MTPKSDERTNLIFDVVLPVDLADEKTAVRKRIEAIAKEIDTTYRCVITFDFDYTSRN